MEFFIPYTLLVRSLLFRIKGIRTTNGSLCLNLKYNLPFPAQVMEGQKLNALFFLHVFVTVLSKNLCENKEEHAAKGRQKAAEWRNLEKKELNKNLMQFHVGLIYKFEHFC